jgi:DNA polymerase V
MFAKTITFLGHVAAGFPSPASDYMEDKINLDNALIKHPTSTFLFQIEGESMIGAFIPPNCRVLVDRIAKAKNGSIVLAVVDGEFTVKRLTIQGTNRKLEPANPKYKSIQITEDLQCEIWGVVTFIITDAKEV